MLGAYYGLVPAIHKYIDTSQPLNGFGATPLTIYEGVGSTPSRAKSGCGCSSGKVGRLSGFGEAELTVPEPTPEALAGMNIQAALVALLVAGTVVAAGVAILGGAKGAPMRANGHRGRAKRRGMRRNAARRKGKVVDLRSAHAQVVHRPGAPSGYSYSGWENSTVEVADLDGNVVYTYVTESQGRIPYSSGSTAANTVLPAAVAAINSGLIFQSKAGAIRAAREAHLATELKRSRPF